MIKKKKKIKFDWNVKIVMFQDMKKYFWLTLFKNIT